MSQEDTTTNANAQTGAGQNNAGGDEPNGQQHNTGGQNAGGDEPQTFDREYVERLRRENAGYRTRAQEAESKAKEFEDRDKTELQRATEKATAAEERATKAEQKALRHEVAAAKGIQAKHLKYLTGSTQEELEASADEILADFPSGSATARPDPDAGRRGNTAATTGAGGMDDLIRGARRPQRASVERA